MQPFSGRPRRSTPGLLRKPTRGIVPSTLLRSWEGQCLHKAAPRQRGGPATQFQPGKYEIFPGRGMPNQKAQKPARSQPEANQTAFLDSQKPAKPGKRGLFGKAALQGVKEVQPFSGRPRRSTPGLLRKPMRGIVPSTLLRLWEGQCLHKAAPKQREVQPVSAR